ncbi:hypothetical protein GCM10008931_31260 [Oceanobacillus oncorhynchi subsp. oncorhynchi]|uniref:hypothetical protein n=1 Tax=Oceanobacillus oncorhynchi TaxID=545501 RepID=UPI0031D949BF
MENIKSILEFIVMVAGGVVSFIAISKIILNVKENREEKRRNNIINNQGIIIGDINQNQYNQTIIYKIEQKIENIHRKQNRMDKLSNWIAIRVERYFSKIIVFIFLIFLGYNLYQEWNNNLLNNLATDFFNTTSQIFHILTISMYKSFGDISTVIIPIIFFISFLLVINSIIFRKNLLKIIPIISILTYGNIMNLKVFSNYSLNEQVIKLIQDNDVFCNGKVHKIAMKIYTSLPA